MTNLPADPAPPFDTGHRVEPTPSVDPQHRRGAGSTLDAVALARRVIGADGLLLVDVRTEAEHAAWAIPGALNIPLDDLPDRLHELPADAELAVICAAGCRSAIAVDLLRQAGRAALDVRGGMAAWAHVYDRTEVQVGPLTIVQIRRRGRGCLSYVIGIAGNAAVVDPPYALAPIDEILAEHHWALRHAFDTHVHADHLSGLHALGERPGVVTHAHPADRIRDVEPVFDGDQVNLSEWAPGCGPLIHVMHTPGHTPGSISLRIGTGIVLTGDTVLVEGIGRPDLEGRPDHRAHQLHRSLQALTGYLADSTTILPAHYDPSRPVFPEQPVATTIGALRRRPEAEADVDQFVADTISRLGAKPPHAHDFVQANRGVPIGAPIAELLEIEAGPNCCAARSVPGR